MTQNTLKRRLRKLFTLPAVGLFLAVLVGVYVIGLYPWMLRWGATDAEVSMSLPGDELTAATGPQSTRAVTIHAPASEVWKWVVQLGQERAGFYSHDWLENLT
jgi:hypothetical protein